MANQWLYRHDNRIHGPVSLRDLEVAMRLGFVRPADLVSRHERHSWKPLADHPELQGLWDPAGGAKQAGRPPKPTREPD